jgi:hypothetical protein
MRLSAVPFLILATVAGAQSPTTKASDGASDLPAHVKSKYIRPGWRLVDGGWVKPEARISLSELVHIVEEDGQFRLIAQTSSRVEPSLRNWRVSVVEIEDSDYVWKLSCVGRRWDDRRAEGTQHLQLIAATDDAMADGRVRLTKIEITPQRSIIQAAVVEADGAKSILVVLAHGMTELAIAPLGHAKTDAIFRAASVRELLFNHPEQARNYLLPVMQRLSNEKDILLPPAGDVYRVFADLPVDDLITQTVARILPDLSDIDPVVRERASRELASLGRRGVQSAMRIDRTRLPPEAADRIGALIARQSHDTRPVEKLLGDDVFLLDCTADPDPNVRARATALLKATKPDRQ